MGQPLGANTKWGSRMNSSATMTDARRQQILMGTGPPTRVLIDTDAANEIDDQFALTWAVLSPEQIELEAIVAEPYSFAHLRQPLLAAAERLATGGRVDETTTGVDKFDVWARNLAKKGIDAEALNFVSPAEGMERSFDEIILVLGKLGVDPGDRVFRGSPTYLTAADTPVDSEGARAIIDAAMADDERPLHVAAIGAVTNVASALLIEPRIADRMVVSWTSGYPTWVNLPNEESLNLVQDRHASRVLFDSGVPLVYLPGYHVGAQLRLSLPEMEAWVRGRGAIGDYLHELYTNNPLHEQRGIESFAGQSWVIWDLINFAWLINRAWVPTIVRDTPLLDEHLIWRQQPGRPPMLEAIGIDRDAVFQDLLMKLETQDEILQGRKGLGQ
jgi:inosine-uridine nucleoside N-ribohydrolase